MPGISSEEKNDGECTVISSKPWNTLQKKESHNTNLAGNISDDNCFRS